jgi:hypothetical protein
MIWKTCKFANSNWASQEKMLVDEKNFCDQMVWAGLETLLFLKAKRKNLKKHSFQNPESVFFIA